MYDGEYELRKDVDRLQLKIADMGEDVGLSYSLIPNVAGVIYKNGEPTPSSLSFSSYITTEEGISFVDGVLEILGSTDGEEWVGEKTVEGHVISIVPSPSVKYYKCTFTIDDVTFDVETVPVLSETEESVNVFLDNEAQVIPCTVDGLTKQNMTVTIKYNAYKGISRIPISLDEESLVLDTGFTTVSNTNGTVSHEGTLVLSVAENIDIAPSGVITLPLTVEDIVFDKVFRWGKVCDGLKGDKGDAGEQGIQGEQGEKGEDGDSIQYIFARTETTVIDDSSDNVNYLPTPTPSTTINTGVFDKNNESKWYENPQGVNGLQKYEWVSQRIKEDEVWGDWSIPTLWAVFSQDGDVGDTGEKGDKGDKGEDGLGFNEDILESVNNMINGDIDASTFCGLTPDKFISSTFEEWSVSGFCGDESILKLKKIGRFVLLNMNSCSGTTSSPTDWVTVNPNNPIPARFRPTEMIYCHNGLFNGMAVMSDGLIKLKFKDNISGVTRGLLTDGTTFDWVSGSLMYFTNETSLDSSLTVTSPSTESSFSITTSDTITFSLVDENNDPMANRAIKITVAKSGGDSVSYNLSTDSNGKIVYGMNVSAGTYTVTASFTATGWAAQTCTRTVTVNKATPYVTYTSSNLQKGYYIIWNSDSRTQVLKNCKGYAWYDDGTKSQITTGNDGKVAYDMSNFTTGSHVFYVGLFDGNRVTNPNNQWHHTYDTGVADPTPVTVTKTPTAIDASNCHTTYCAGWSGVTLANLRSNDSSAMKSSVATGGGTYKTPKSVIVALPVTVPSTATIKSVTVNTWTGHFGASATVNAGAFAGWTVELWTGSPTGSGTKISTTKTTSALTKSNWNKWVKSSMVWTPPQVTAMAGHYNTLYVRLLPTPNTATNPCTVGLDKVELQVSYTG